MSDRGRGAAGPAELRLDVLHEYLAAPRAGRWRAFLAGQSAVTPTGDGLRLSIVEAGRRAYADAQIDDYQGRRRGDFLWHPPLTLEVRARFSAQAATAMTPGLRGTAGFGFWNDPFGMTGARLPALPRALWFFYASPPSDMKLDLATPGWGWKAATIDASRLPARLALLTAPLAVPLLNLPAVYRRVWPAAQRVLRIAEAPVTADMTQWHDYRLTWHATEAVFSVDGSEVLRCDTPPAGPLGLVIWIDNQYLVATPWGRLRYGLLDVPAGQWLELAGVVVERP
ncbi:MAG TPA: hypothetical protein VGA61_05105 [Anaerolineae bacterium]